MERRNAKRNPRHAARNVAKALAREARHAEQQIAGDADGGDRNVADTAKRAVVHDAAVPVLVDVAGLGAGGVVNAAPARRRQRRQGREAR